MPLNPNETVEIKRLDISAYRKARSILYHSYKNEPIFQLLLDASRPGYDQRIRATIRELVKLHFDRNETVLGLLSSKSNRIIGIAFIGNVEIKNDITKQWLWRFKMMLTAGIGGTNRFIEYYDQVQKKLPSDAHRMLSLIGIDPEFQGKGYGQQLMDAVHEVCKNDKSSIGLFLDTANSRIIDFYEKMGYEHYDDLDIDGIKDAILFRPSDKEKT